MASRWARPLAGALGAVPLLGSQQRRWASCEEKQAPAFQTAKCVKNEAHTHNTRLITLALPSDWTNKGPIANVVVKASIAAPQETGCCACCKCPSPCSCPKQANGCCACCQCPAPCSCPKREADQQAAKAESGCCACCKCPPPCTCPKQANGCCACCKCEGTCGCPKKEAPTSTSVARNYNPLSSESGSKITLLVKKYPEAKMGTKLHSLQAGDEVEVRGPNQQWTFVEGKYSHYGMIAGGTGITPLVQAAEYIIKHDTAKVTMVTFNKTPEDVLLRKQLAQLEVSSGGRFKVYHVVESGAGTGEVEGTADSEEVLSSLLPEPGAGVLVMVCGRPAMTAAVAGPKTKDFKQGEVGGVLKKLGYWAAQVWKV